MSYQPGVPTGTVPLNQDYASINGNFTALNTAFNSDHVPLTTAPGTPPYGYHTAVHLVPQSAITNTPGYGQFYSQTITDVNTDQALFWNTGTGNRTVQMTVPIVPVAANPGYTFLPGGLIMQWGTDTQLTGGLTNFLINFTSIPFVVMLTPTSASATANGMLRIITASTTAAHFQIGNATGNSQSYTYNWIAIGT